MNQLRPAILNICISIILSLLVSSLLANFGVYENYLTMIIAGTVFFSPLVCGMCSGLLMVYSIISYDKEGTRDIGYKLFVQSLVVGIYCLILTVWHIFAGLLYLVATKTAASWFAGILTSLCVAIGSLGLFCLATWLLQDKHAIWWSPTVMCFYPLALLSVKLDFGFHLAIIGGFILFWLLMIVNYKGITQAGDRVPMIQIDGR